MNTNAERLYSRAKPCAVLVGGVRACTIFNPIEKLIGDENLTCELVGLFLSPRVGIDIINIVDGAFAMQQDVAELVQVGGLFDLERGAGAVLFAELSGALVDAST